MALLLASATGAAAGTVRTALNGPGLANQPSVLASLITRCDGAVFLLNVTAVANAGTDTLDVYLQHSADDGTTWDDFVHFTQVLGNGGAKKFLATWVKNYTPTTAMKPPADGALAAGVQIGPVGGVWAVKAVIVGGTAAFTYKVQADFSQMGR